MGSAGPERPRTLNMSVHPTGLPGGAGSGSCGGCAWGQDGRCRMAPGEPEVTAETPACAAYEPPLDCGTCGACCREAFDVVAVEPDDPMGEHAELVQVHLDGWRSMRRVPGLYGKTRCAALVGDGDGAPWRCTLYADRPTSCRELELGSANCLLARRRLGLSWGEPEGPGLPVLD